MPGLAEERAAPGACRSALLLGRIPVLAEDLSAYLRYEGALVAHGFDLDAARDCPVTAYRVPV